MKIYDFETKIPLFGQELEFYTLSKVVQFYDGQIHHPDSVHVPVQCACNIMIAIHLYYKSLLTELLVSLS